MLSGERKNGRIVSYEYVRLFATILVVIGHSNYLTITTKYGGWTIPLSQYQMYYQICCFIK